MGSTYRNLVPWLLAICLIAGCQGVTQPAAPSSPYSVDDSACRWSERIYMGETAGVGEVMIEPIAGTADAVVAELAGDSPAFSHDGGLVATVDGEEVRVWRAADGKPQFVLPGDAVVFSPDGHALAVSQGDEWHLWNTATNEEQYRLADPASSLNFSADGRTILLQNGTGGLRLYDAATGAERLQLEGVSSPVVLNPDGTLLAGVRRKDAGAADFETILLWDTATGTEHRILQAEIQSEMPLAGIRGHHRINSLAFSPDGRTLLSAGPDAIRLWDTASGKHLRCFQTPNHSGASAIAWDADAHTILGEENSEVYIWDANTNYPTDTLGLNREFGVEVPETAAGTLATEDGNLIALGGSDEAMGHNAYVWNINSRQLVGVLPTPGLLAGAVLSPGGGRAVTVTKYNVASGSPEDTGDEGAEPSSPKVETVLWDLHHPSVGLAAAAQRSYWDALNAAANGEPSATQLRFVRKARSLSPDLFGNAATPDQSATADYAAYLAGLRELAALADAADPAATAFAAELRNTTPGWLEWSKEDLVQQISYYMTGWESNDKAGLVAAYRRTAELAPDVAREPKITGALLNILAPKAIARAREGDIEGATALFRAALSPYPNLPLDPGTAAQRTYAQALVDAAYFTAMDGDIAGAGAEFADALALDPALAASPPDYVQVYCAMGTGAAAGETAASLCAKLDVRIAPIALGETVTGTLAAGISDFWRLDAVSATALTADLVADPVAGDGDFYPDVAILGPDGVPIETSADLTGDGERTQAALPRLGRYLIAVSNYGDTRGSYQLTITRTDTGTDTQGSNP